MKEIYLISGLGADKRVFEFIDLTDFKVNHIKWVPPIKDESIENYAQKLTDQIITPRPILIGVSFGGMICIEIGKLIETEKIIIISSAKTSAEIPIWFRVAGGLKFHKLFSAKFLQSVNSLTYWFFGVKSKKEKELLATIISETDPNFLKWALGQIVRWKNCRHLKNVVHIHGSKDRLLPARNPDIKIDDGGHLMIINKGLELGQIIRKILI